MPRSGYEPTISGVRSDALPTVPQPFLNELDISQNKCDQI